MGCGVMKTVGGGEMGEVSFLSSQYCVRLAILRAGALAPALEGPLPRVTGVLRRMIEFA